MKTTFRSKNNRARTHAFILGGFIVVLTIIFFTTSLFSKTFYTSMVGLTGARVATGQSVSTFFSLFSSKASLQNKNNQLEQELLEKDTKLADQEILVKENADLKAMLHFKNETGNILARVMSKPPFTPYDVFVVDAGEEQGVVVGNRVMIGQIYIGTVTSVSSDSSLITLLSTSDNANEAYIGDEALPVTLNGRGGGNFETTLPLGSKVSEGDLVVTYYSQTPYQIGTVSKIIDNEDNTFMTVLLTLPFNLYSLSHVEIIP
jgi:cell shape-determining protein MreC